jgi:hypothetical protein
LYKKNFIIVVLGLSPIVATSKANAIDLLPLPTSIVRNVPSIYSLSSVKGISSKTIRVFYKLNDLVSVKFQQ